MTRFFAGNSLRRASLVSHPSGDETAARMGHPGVVPVLKRTIAKADPCGMTNKRTDNIKSNGRGEMRRSFHCGGKCAASGRDDEGLGVGSKPPLSQEARHEAPGRHRGLLRWGLWLRVVRWLIFTAEESSEEALFLRLSRLSCWDSGVR